MTRLVALAAIFLFVADLAPDPKRAPGGGCQKASQSTPVD
jgi:hypothetical protein